MNDIICLILAAGRGTRMRSKTPKPLHTICGKPMLGHLIESVKTAGVKKVVLVLGHQADIVGKHFDGYDKVIQRKQLGSGDAVNSASKIIEKFSGDVMVLYSDTPLLSSETIGRLIATHTENEYGCTLLSVNADNPTGYGRIVRDRLGKVFKIVEEKDAELCEKDIKEINVGAYVFKKDALLDNIRKIKKNDKKNEYYLTDIVNILSKAKIKIGAVLTEDKDECLGINSRVELAKANAVLRRIILKKFMEEGVTLVDPETTYIDEDVKIGMDTVIYPYTVIEEGVEIGEDCRIGPFARLRPGTVLGDGCEVGNFVELVRTKVGPNCKVKHHSYFGDSVLGRDINIGAGTITANYDGKNKHKTFIDNKAFIGVGTVIIAPVKIGKNAKTGAGSVVTKNHNVPDGATVVGIPAKVFKNKK